VEATFNWYWLVDGLRAEGYPVVLANPAAMQQYAGVKHTDNESDAFFVAELLRLLPLLTPALMGDPRCDPESPIVWMVDAAAADPVGGSIT
jgi:hypothetical protein